MLCAHQSPYTGRTHRHFTPPEKQTPLLGIEPVAPPPSWAPSQDVIPLRQSTTRASQVLQYVPINAHATWQPRSVDREQWRPKGRQDIITALSQLSQHGEFRHVSVSERQRSRQCGQNLRESSCAFPKGCTATGSRRERSSNGGQRRDKSVHISTTKVSFSAIILILCHYLIASTTV